MIKPLNKDKKYIFPHSGEPEVMPKEETPPKEIEFHKLKLTVRADSEDNLIAAIAPALNSFMLRKDKKTGDDCSDNWNYCWHLQKK